MYTLTYIRKKRGSTSKSLYDYELSTSKSLHDYDFNSPLLPLGGCTCAGALCEARMPASKPFPKRITYIIFRAQCSGSLRARLSEDTLYFVFEIEKDTILTHKATKDSRMKS